MLFSVAFHFTFHVALFQRLPLVVGFLSLAHTQFDFQMWTEKVNLQGNQRKAFLIYLLLKLHNFFFPGEKFPNAQGIVIVDIPFIERAYVKIMEKKLAIFDAGVGVLHSYFSIARGLNLGANKSNADLNRLEHEILVTRFSVGQDMPDIVLGLVHSSDPRTDRCKNTRFQKKKDLRTIASENNIIYIYSLNVGPIPHFLL